MRFFFDKLLEENSFYVGSIEAVYYNKMRQEVEIIVKFETVPMAKYRKRFKYNGKFDSKLAEFCRDFLLFEEPYVANMERAKGLPVLATVKMQDNGMLEVDKIILNDGTFRKGDNIVGETFMNN